MRDLVRRNSSGEMDQVRSGIDQVFADAFFRNWPSRGQGTFPPVDLYSKEGSLVVNSIAALSFRYRLNLMELMQALKQECCGLKCLKLTN